MLIDALKPFFRRDIQKLREEIEAYQDEEKIWWVENEIANSAGNLCLHLLGNMQHFLGAHLGNTGYARKRELEFTQKNVPRTRLLEMVDHTLVVVERTLDQLKEEQLEEEFPEMIFDKNVSVETLLLHVITHLNYHLGQINYHRRLLDNQR